MSVSVTTRPPRPGETDGRDYHFIDDKRFVRMREGDELLEWARVFDNFYGTPRAPVEAAIKSGRDILFDIDWQGAQQLAEKMKHDVVRVFMLPPSVDGARAAPADARAGQREVVRRRMEARQPRSAIGRSTTTSIVNADIDGSLAGLKAILTAERLKRERLDGLGAFVREMQKTL